MNTNYFNELNAVNVNGHTEKKNGLTYLSWPYAWGELKKRYPDTVYTVYEDASGRFYHTDGKTCWVKTGVTVNGVEHIEYLPVMDHRNKSIPLESITSFDVNKAIQRSLTKAAARHGIGLYVYAGEDLPEDEKVAEANQEAPKQERGKMDHLKCEVCGAIIKDHISPTGKKTSAMDIAIKSMNEFGQQMCASCVMLAADP